MASLSSHWETAWQELGLAVSANRFEDLVRRYSEPHRAYHTIRHIEECLERFEDASSEMESQGVVRLALFFHDAVYEPRRSDNEERSARLAADALLAAGTPQAIRDVVTQMILATKDHETGAGNSDIDYVVDIDLAILGAAPDRFREYEDQIRKEYSWVPGPIFNFRRGRFLQQLLKRPNIYSTLFFRQRLEVKARKNISLLTGQGIGN